MTSKSQIKLVRSLHQKKFREQENLFIAEGVKIVNEIMNFHPSVITMLLFTSENKQYINPDLIPGTVKTIELGSNDFRKISVLKNPQGILAVLQKPSIHLPSFSDVGNLVLILDSIRDPGNLGTIIRLADWFGIGNIFCSEDTVECFNPKVVQATMGAILRVNIFYAGLKKLLEDIAQAGFTVYGSFLKGENIYTKNLHLPAAIILGNESHGISPELLPSIDKNIFIPNYSLSANHAESLNVSLAASIIISEFRRLSV